MKNGKKYDTERTIFALTTVFGKSSVAVIRISGNDALKTLSHFDIDKKIKPRFATLIDLYDKSHQLIDSGIMIYFSAPHSFTGEDVIELQVHGSKAVIKNVLDELAKIFVMAEPGEFSLRAFLNGKFDLTQIEGIADLIDAETTLQAKQAIKQISGELERLYSHWRQVLIKTQSKIEAYIDFPEDITTQEDELIKINQEVQTLIQSILNHINDERRGERLREGLHVVITGEPNVGKSTLFNYLAKRNIAIVSEYEGTTRDVLEAHIDIGGYPIILSDTAGIRESLDPIESEGIQRAKKRSSEADLRIELLPFNQRHSLNCHTADSDTIYVLSKADDIKPLSKPIYGKSTAVEESFDNKIATEIELRKRSILDNQTIRIGDTDFLPISIVKEIGTSHLISLIKEKMKEKFWCDKETPLITRQRHRNCIQRALEHLQRFNISKPIELMSEDLRLAAVELGKITGIISVEEILDSVFSTFCVGK
ncbi:tRNA uridine-5-carboxymethylaminomethyl(34) synthesis GTPase MnmE [Wolbachia endosymbiont of Pentalonia nigronervosa]|uniref:tRNA uridine-5-carboxymethylaminomethyl(34) synthesis GTPase MnmE n=1 Tax=Wolbachia endosymbiont of Pentalonia nigronervosa TaxID=1301914 RepID=UPI00165FAA40|nr:tRNA uridine-5-carboxymethylaminomethyl(34) synthesis GTPase MnmE [Wolbachia endosymbiont of Pentalonia nigronervosa]MBD0391147.1 tRNA uridine-5-carboxymethylaminomethyl(34) synthesis GTPase MnmE [Wolbachia endosymbiont of Pentalonia nigronervosa]